jgi:hypothetical protein
MKAVDKVSWPANPVEQVLETLILVAAAVVVGVGTMAMCLPGVLGLV